MKRIVFSVRAVASQRANSNLETIRVLNVTVTATIRLAAGFHRRHRMKKSHHVIKQVFALKAEAGT